MSINISKENLLNNHWWYTSQQILFIEQAVEMILEECCRRSWTTFWKRTSWRDRICLLGGKKITTSSLVTKFGLGSVEDIFFCYTI